MKLRNFALSAIAVAASLNLSAQEPAQNWHHLDKEKDGVQGMSTIKAYDELLKGKKSKTVIVAVIDSGMEEVHDDLKNVMWVNEGEIPNNGIDDDKNGYIDDINGWNFIGGKDGNVDQDNLEITRLLRKYTAMFDGKTEADISKKEMDAFKEYQKIKDEVAENLAASAPVLERLRGFNSVIEMIQEKLDGKEATEENIDALGLTGEGIEETVAIIKRNMGEGSLEDLHEYFQSGIDYYSGQVDYYYNVDFDPRNIVGDDYDNLKEKGYGNNTIEGPDATHGTHVGGIIGAERGNGIGMDGVADNVRLMSIRAVPNGDERDKDVAAAIRYAVDNGATVINMSFGKAYSWNKDIVNKAVKYALKKDVLLVHAAGNSNQNNDFMDNFPNDSYKKNPSKKAANWLEIGALDWKEGELTPARFSNYGAENVDVFAPGVDIYATWVDNGYKAISGTSMASPACAGVAAVLRSYFPSLSAKEVKEIIMNSSVKLDMDVLKPGEKKGGSTVKFSELSVSGGVVNMYEAVKMAMAMSK